MPKILAQAGFEWLVVDMEHSSIDLGDLLPLFISIENNDRNEAEAAVSLAKE